VWSDNGKSITYSRIGQQPGIYTTRVDGGGKREQVLALKGFHWLVGWTPDRSTLLYGVVENTRSSIMAHSDAQARTVVGPGNTWGGRLSRDGKWLAYYALESGTFEVYVTPFPEGGARWLSLTAACCSCTPTPTTSRWAPAARSRGSWRRMCGSTS